MNRRRAAAESTSLAGVLGRSQAVDCVAAVVVYGPPVDAVSEALLVANAVVEAGADGSDGAGEGHDGDGGELHGEDMELFGLVGRSEKLL